MLTHRQSITALLLGILLLVFGTTVPAGPVNINTADAATLARELKGIGIKRAQAIVDYRTQHGPFRSADELGLVKGIGPAAIGKNRESIRTDTKGAPATPKPATGTMSKGPPASTAPTNKK